MFHGGTTRGFMNGANMNVGEPYAPQVSSYDYDAPLDEAGNPTEKYFRFRDVIKKYLPAGDSLPPVPAPNKAIAINNIQLKTAAGLFENLPTPILSKTPLSFEAINQGYGFVLYRTKIPSRGKGVLKIDKLRDFATVYVNGKRVGEMDRRLEQDSLLLDHIPKNATLDILVENNGRINYGPYLTDNRKGILGQVILNNSKLSNWKLYSLPFNELVNLKFTPASNNSSKQQPAFYKANFVVNEVADTYLDMSSFGKGFVFLNGRHLGKYWQIGPQQTIYVPACWLKKGANEMIVFDALKGGHTTLNTLQHPVLNQSSVTK
jgi:beta-galactosidase